MATTTRIPGMSAWPMVRAWLVILTVSIGYAVLGCLAARGLGWPWWVGLLPPAITVAAAESIRWMTKGTPMQGTQTATAVTAEDEPRLSAVVDRLCALSGQDRPDLQVMEMAAPNSLVYVVPGQGPTLCVTRGLLDDLSTEQLEVVLAHEFAHLAHRDTRVMALADGMAGWALTLPGAAFMLIGRLDTRACALAHRCGSPWRPAFTSMGAAGLSSRRARPTVPRRLVVPLLVLAGLARTVLIALALAVVCLIIPGAFVAAPGFVISAFLARRRELAADRAAAALTGSPATLAAALRTIVRGLHAAPSTDLRQSREASALAIVAFHSSTDRSGVSLSRLFDTHPPMRSRQEHLEDLSRRMGAPG